MGVQGIVASGWEPVADALEQVVRTDGGAGSAVCVYVDGAPVVDAWGGDADGDRPWCRDTTACVFSATKGVAAVCAHLLVERGLLDLEAPVARYWPEFAGGGKADLKVRWLLTHQAGLPLVEPAFTFDDLVAVAPVLRALEAQRPLWEPGTQVGYHAITYGYLVGELVRRVSGRSLGTFFRDEIAQPLGLQAWIGLPEQASVDLALLERTGAPSGLAEAILAAGPDSPMAPLLKALTLGGALPLNLIGDGGFNDRRVLAVELPAAGLVADARSLARIYAATVAEVDGVRLLQDPAACVPLQTTDTPAFGAPAGAPRTLDFALGFLARPLLGPASFGHPGASGALGFADVEQRVGFGYVPRLMREEAEDGRAADLIAAVRRILR